MTSRTLGAVEAGGTKFRAAIFEADPFSQIPTAQVRIATTTPEETLDAVVEFFSRHDKVDALGIASFGPLNVKAGEANFGSIAATPKEHWTGAPLLTTLADALGCPADIQTDVEAAAVAEHQYGEGRGHDQVAYVTVGTGIGVGVAIDGVPFRGNDHLELGHMPVRRNPDDNFAGICPFHGDCLEGMAAGPAIQQRWGDRPSNLADNEDVWRIEADYLAQLVRVITYTFSPDRILFSGGVGARLGLAELIAEAATADLNGYSVSQSDSTKVVATAGLGNDAGLIGAALLARAIA